MVPHDTGLRVVIAPQIYISLEPGLAAVQQPDYQPIQREIPVVWTQDGADFRLDISLPDSTMLDILFPAQIESLHVNGATLWALSDEPCATLSGTQVQMTPAGLRLTSTTGGALHILAHLADQKRTNAK